MEFLFACPYPLPDTPTPPHGHTSKSAAHARKLQDNSGNASTRTPTAYCLMLMKQGACPIPMTLCQTAAQAHSKCNIFVSCALKHISIGVLNQH